MDTPETLIARLEALIAKWRDAIALSERDVAAGEYSEPGIDSQRGRRLAAREFIEDLNGLRDAAHALSGATPAADEAFTVRTLAAEYGWTYTGHVGTWLRQQLRDLHTLRQANALTPVSPTAPEQEKHSDYKPAFSSPDSPDGTTLMISVMREDDGRFSAEWQSGGEAGAGDSSSTPIGALANMLAVLLKVEEDRLRGGERLRYARTCGLLLEASVSTGSEGWRDSRGYRLPPYVSVVQREHGGVQLEGHTATQDWELEINADGSAESFAQYPVAPPASAGSDK